MRSKTRTRPQHSGVVGGVIAALVVGALATTPTAAMAVSSCETSVPTNFETVGTTMSQVWSAAGPAGTAVDIEIPDLCVSMDAVVTVDSNTASVLIDIMGDGTSFASIRLTPPTIDYTGVAQVDLTIVDGPASFSLELYGLFGVDPTSFDFERPDPVAEPLGSPGFFPLPPITLRDGASLRVELVRSTAPVAIELVDVPSRGVVVTPSSSVRETIGVDVLVTDGVSSTRYQFFLWSGVEIPTGAVWAPNPPPVAVEPGGTGFFNLSGSFVPSDSECEIRVRAEPDIDIVTEPPSLQGVSFEPVGVRVLDADFVGVLSVSYDLSCRLPDDSTSGFDYTLVLYVGVPLPAPELADTGSSPTTSSMLVGMLGLMGAGAMLAAAGRARAQRRG